MAAFVILIDHSNINYRDTNIEQLLRAFLDSVDFGEENGELLVRLYGGWNEKGNHTDERTAVLNFYMTNGPSFIKVQDKYCRVRYEFADDLLLNGVENVILNTFVTRNYGDIKIREASSKPCSHPNCERKKIIKWVRSKRGCTAPGCPNKFSDVFATREQKQIDILLATDLIHAAYEKNFKAIALASNDLDFTPSIYYSSKIFHPLQVHVVKWSERTFYWENDNKIENIIFCNY